MNEKNDLFSGLKKTGVALLTMLGGLVAVSFVITAVSSAIKPAKPAKVAPPLNCSSQKGMDRGLTEKGFAFAYSIDARSIYVSKYVVDGSRYFVTLRRGGGGNLQCIQMRGEFDIYSRDARVKISGPTLAGLPVHAKEDIWMRDVYPIQQSVLGSTLGPDFEIVGRIGSLSFYTNKAVLGSISVFEETPAGLTAVADVRIVMLERLDTGTLPLAGYAHFAPPDTGE